MRKEVGLFLGGIAIGVLSGIIVERKRKVVLDKIRELEFKLNTLSLRESGKELVRDILGKLKFLSKNGKSLSEEEKDLILEDVRQKIKQLEAWNKTNG
jgi:hypothetical protein